MSKIALITAPKPFVDPHISLIQTNAIRSWKALGDEVEILMMGDEIGMAEICKDYSLNHFPEVETNEKGIPYIGAMFDLAKNNTKAPIIAFVNADIILFSDFLITTNHIGDKYSDYLIVGQRWDHYEKSEISPLENKWEESYRNFVITNGYLHHPAGSDYFVFPRHLYNETPNFTVGRAGWDNWMIYHAVTSPWPAIDATEQIMVVHQNHDYSHLPGGASHYGLADTTRNQTLGGGRKNMFNLWDVNKIISKNKIKTPPITLVRLLRKIERFIQPKNESGIRWKLLLFSQKQRRKLVNKMFPKK